MKEKTYKIQIIGGKESPFRVTWAEGFKTFEDAEKRMKQDRKAIRDSYGDAWPFIAVTYL